VCVYVCIYIHISIYLYIYIHIYIYVCLCVCIRVWDEKTYLPLHRVNPRHTAEVLLVYSVIYAYYYTYTTCTDGLYTKGTRAHTQKELIHHPFIYSVIYMLICIQYIYIILDTLHRPCS